MYILILQRESKLISYTQLKVLCMARVFSADPDRRQLYDSWFEILLYHLSYIIWLFLYIRWEITKLCHFSKATGTWKQTPKSYFLIEYLKTLDTGLREYLKQNLIIASKIYSSFLIIIQASKWEMLCNI